MRQLTKSGKGIAKEAPTLISGTRKEVYKTFQRLFYRFDEIKYEQILNKIKNNI